ncbi:MAG: glycyl-radical enzyme activating protein [Eubacterium sp.]|nr:glycyl-radical enzyme activating protein [Eubacterium sp.]
MQGTVFNIQHCSVHDGPGIRTTVFLKGCPLRCRWCANPESQKAEPELGWTAGDCIACGGCLYMLKDYGIKTDGDSIFWHVTAVPEAARVKRACPSAALHVIGKEMTVDKVLAEVEKDIPFYTSSGGGITVSGGEPLMQPEFTLALLTEAKKRGIHTAIETSSFGNTEYLLAIAGQLDYFLTDIKSMDDALHTENTGVSNALILKNIQAVRTAYPDLTLRVRTPVIPDFNDNAAAIAAIRDFVKSLGANTEYELLKYHRLGEPKYRSLHRKYPMGEVQLDDELFLGLIEVANL